MKYLFIDFGFGDFRTDFNFIQKNNNKCGMLKKVRAFMQYE